MFVCVYYVFALSCVGSGLATGWSLVQGVLPVVHKCEIKKPHKRRPRPDRASAPRKKKKSLSVDVVYSSGPVVTTKHNVLILFQYVLFNQMTICATIMTT
jgi:hypothetical protein